MKDPTNSKELKKVLEKFNGPYSVSQVYKLNMLRARLTNQGNGHLKPLCDSYVSQLIAKKRDRWGKNARR